MDRWIRWTVAFAVFALVFGASLVVAGAATEPVAPEDSPVTFQTEASRPGDRGMYKTALVVVKDGQGEYYDMNARFAFERLDDRLMLGRDGALAPAASFVAEWRSEPFRLDLRGLLEMPPLPQIDIPNCWPSTSIDWTDEDAVEDWEDAMDDCEDDVDDAVDDFDDAMDDWEEAFEERMEAWEDALDREFHTVQATGWHTTHHSGNKTAALSYRDDTTFPFPVATRGLAFSGSVAIEQVAGRVVFTEPVEVPGPCGWRTSLQDGPQDMWQPIVVHGECPADMELGFATVRHEPGPIAMSVSGRDRVGGQPAVVFSMPDDPDRLRLWFTADTPYPVRVLTLTESVPEPVRQALGRSYEAPEFYVLHELIEFEPGHDAPDVVAPTLSPVGARSATGPDLAGFTHPWPLATAWAEALDPSKATTACRTWRDWVAAHPEAIVQVADFAYLETPDPDHADPIIDEAWTIVAADGTARRAAVLTRHTESALDLPVVAPARAGSAMAPAGAPRDPDAGTSLFAAGDALHSWPSAALAPAQDQLRAQSARQPVRVTSHACQDAQLPELLPPPQAGPMPTVAGAADILLAMSGTHATTYGMQDVCLGTCSSGEARLTVGVSPAAPGGGDAVDLLTLGSDGGLRMHMASGDPYPEPTFSDDAWDPSRGRDPWGFEVASSGVWTMPQPATAATLAAAGAAAGGLVLLWPALKAALAALPMFSRIRDEDLLDHPVRIQIHQMVSEQPGIHFQEMVRRAGKGRGTMEHHLRKMVASGMLVEKAERGFTCYFAKGKVDRHLMVAAPLLKSEGARQILHAVHEQPGTAALDLAQHLGMATSTVNYHVKKLVDAGLLGTQRDGRFLRLALTGIGEQALGQYGST